uniref:Spermatogenesis-associated protein 2 PUB-like domain-containing protein n=1 Tax=Oreochromis aureus TaxID=47969 RepID=A0AAZ1XRT3_OREAU
MKDGTGAVEPAPSRGDVYADYVKCYLEERAEVGPCRDPQLLKKAAQYLLSEAEIGGTFTMFPFYQAVTERCEAQRDFRKHLSAFIRASEVLETLCVNLFLQPWKKEIRTLKTFTGPFVYCLEPVFSNSTIQSVLASIGYVPHTDPKQCEYRLSEDVNADKAMLVGFELLLARVECNHFLELQEDQLRPQVLYLDTRLVTTPQPKPQHYHLCSVDPSIMEMQRTYPDLAIRGRPLLPDKPHKVCSSTKAVSAADLPKTDCTENPCTAVAAVLITNDDGKAQQSLDGNRRGRHGNGRNSGTVNSGGAGAPGDTGSDTRRSRVEDELSGPQAISLHITLRAGATAQPPTQHNTGPQDESAVKSELSSLSSVEEEEQELRGLAERMGQVRVQESEHETTRKEGDNTNKDRRKQIRKANTEGETKKRSLRKPVMGKASALSHDDSAHTRPQQCDATVTNEQPAECQPSPSADSTADTQRQREGDPGGPGDENAGPAEEEQVAQSFVIVEQCRD